MAIAVGANTGSTSTSFSHTVAAGSDLVLYFAVGARNGDITGATYNGVAMTEIWNAGAPSVSNGNPMAKGYVLINPPVGTHTLAVTTTGSRSHCIAVNLSGVNQSTPNRTAAVGSNTSNAFTSSSLSPVSAVDDVVVDFCKAGANVTVSALAPGAGQTHLTVPDVTSGKAGASHKAGAAGNTAMSWTWTTAAAYAHGAVAFIPAGALDPPDGTVTIGATETRSTSHRFEFSDTSTNTTGYEYRIDGGSPVDIGNPSPKAHKIWNLTPSTAYNSPGLEVRPYNLDGPGSWSTAASFTTTAAAAPVFSRSNKSFRLQSQTSGETATGDGGSSTLPMSASFEFGSTATLYRAHKSITHACKISKPFVVVTANSMVADSTITLWDDGAATSVSITIPAGQTGTFKDTVNEHTFSGTTEGWWIADHGAGGGSYTGRSFGHEITPTDTNLILSWLGPHSSGETNFVSTASRYLLPAGTRSIDATETQAELRALFPGTLTALRVAGSNGQTDPFTGVATVGFRKNAADTNLVALWDSANETGGGDRIMIVTNLTDTAAVAAGDEITLFARPHAGATGSTRDVTWFGTLESDNSSDAGEFLLAIGATGGFSSISTGTYYSAVAGEGVYNSTESNAQAPVPFSARLFRFTARVADANNGACTITLRRNGVDTDLQLNFLASDTGVTKEFPIDEFEDFAADDLISYKIEHTSGAQLRIQYIGIAGAALNESLAATGAMVWTSSAALTSGATGDMGSVGALAWTGTAGLSAVGDLGAIGAMVLAPSASLNATGDLAAIGASAWTGAADLNGVGGLNAAGAIAWSADANLGSPADLSATDAITWTGTATASATGALAALGATTGSFAAGLTATGALAATGSVSWVGTADLVAPTANDLAAVGAIAWTGAATINASGALSAVGALAFSPVAALNATGTLAGLGALSWGATAVSDAIGQLTAIGAIAWTGSASLGQSSGLTATGAITITAAADLSAVGQLTAIGVLNWSASAAMSDAAALAFEAPGYLLRTRHGALLRTRHEARFPPRHGYSS